MAQSIARTTILIVEDDPDDQAFAAEVLQPHYEVDFAADAQEARGKLIGWPPELLICDIYMPGEPGMDLAETILATRKHEIEVLMVTGADDPKFKQKAQELGAAGYLVKPFSGDELLAAVNDALAGQPSETEAQPVESEDYSTRRR